MEKNLLQVLWIDDEHEKLEGIKAEALSEGIRLNGYKSLTSGMHELEQNYMLYDAVLFDAKFFEEDSNVAGTEDTKYVFRAKDRLSKIPKSFEIFVLTGQAEAYGDNTFKKVFENVFRKGQGLDLLFNALKEAANTLPDRQLKNEHQLAFACCTKKYLGSDEPTIWLLQLLKIKDTNETEFYFNTIRKFVEQLFRGFHQHGLLPDAFISKGQVAINPSSKFLMGKNTQGKYHIENNLKHLDETHLPNQIAQYLRTLISVTNQESHTGSNRPTNTPYLFKSLLYQLLDTLSWFKGYIDSHPSKQNWESIVHPSSTQNDVNNNEIEGQWLSGHIDNVTTKGSAFFTPEDQSGNIYIPKDLVDAHGLQPKQPVKACVAPYDDPIHGKTQRVMQIQTL
jgi:hypothetical protein